MAEKDLLKELGEALGKGLDAAVKGGKEAVAKAQEYAASEDGQKLKAQINQGIDAAKAKVQELSGNEKVQGIVAKADQVVTEAAGKVKAYADSEEGKTLITKVKAAGVTAYELGKDAVGKVAKEAESAIEKAKNK